MSLSSDRSQVNLTRGTERRLEPTPRVVLFDLDDTLCDHHGSLLIRLDYSFEPVFPDPEQRQEVVRESVTRSDWGTEHFEGLLASFGVDDPSAVRTVRERYIADRYRGLQLFEDSLDTLKAVRQVARTGLITNGPTDIQQPKIDLLGIEHHFEVVLISESVGVWKPDPAIFHMALDHIDAEPHEAIYVGDSPVADVPGARAAGITSVWMNRRGMEWTGEEPPDIEVRTLHELQIALGLATG